jgi:uncharacterized protein (TIGR02001 family)
MIRWLVAAGLLALSATAFASENLPDSPIQVTVSGSAMTDYIYRGATLSAHCPAIGSDIEFRFGDFYVKSGITSVNLTTSPPAEITFAGGIRHAFGSLELDLGATYYHYPNEVMAGVPTDTDYWEAQARGSYELPNKLKFTGELSWSPNISKSGAWSKYSKLGFEFILPEKLIIKGIDATLSGGVGRYWFGNVAPEIGDYRLPAYTYWHAGVALKVEPLTLDLRYHNTNLSKEDCYVFTGDLGATPGGAVNNFSNPNGLRSNWCGATLVAKLSVELEYPKSK